MKIGVLDYGAGNLRNVCRAIEHLGYEFSLVSKHEEFSSIDKLVIPGVGAFKVAMKNLRELALVEAIKGFSDQGKPILGICLGMQLLFTKSYEYGESNGIGLLCGEVNKLHKSNEYWKQNFKIPHIGWNELEIKDSTPAHLNNIEKDDAVYFVHSYQVMNISKDVKSVYCDYEGVKILSAIQKNNIYACQFHPEKSGESGLKIIDNFLKNCN